MQKAFPFTYQGYRDLIHLLQNHDYVFTNYHDHQKFKRSVILRHDIDNDITKALKMAETEAEEQVNSTYFVLLRTDAYNPASAKNIARLKRLQELGHEVGLHFDEKAYGPQTIEEIKAHIMNEISILASLLGAPVSTVSMHRPSPLMLESEIVIPGIINSYGHVFFKEFKYLSDSRRNWREPAREIIRSGRFEKLHILTHPFWYHDTEENISKTLMDFIESARDERLIQVQENIKDLESILPQAVQTDENRK